MYHPAFKLMLTIVVGVGMGFGLLSATCGGLQDFAHVDHDSPLKEGSMWIALGTAPLALTRLFIYFRESFLRSIADLPAEQQKPKRRRFALVMIAILTSLGAIGTWVYLRQAKINEAVALVEPAHMKFQNSDDVGWSGPEAGVTVGTSIPVELYCNRSYRLRLTCGGIKCELTFMDKDKGVMEVWSSDAERACKGNYYGMVKPTTAGWLRLRALLTRHGKTQVLELPPVEVRSSKLGDQHRPPRPDQD